MLIVSITRSGRLQKSENEKKNFYGTFSLAVFLFPVIKSDEKVSGFVYFRKGREKNVKKIIIKKKNFPHFGRFFDHFWSLVCLKR